MYKITLVVVFFLLSFTFNTFSQERLTCTNQFLQVFGPEGNLLSYDLPTNSFVIEPNNAGARLNAAGFRTADGFGYGILQDTDRLFRIGHEGTTVDLGVVEGLPTDRVYIAGDFADDGLLYVNSQGLANELYAIDVENRIVVRTLNIAGMSFSIGDVAFNPIDGLLYAFTQDVIGTEETAPAQLIAIDITTETFEIIGPTGLDPITRVGAMFADGDGNIYGIDRNIAGIFYEFDTETGNAMERGQALLLGPDQGPNDGFFCRLAPRNVPTLSQWGLIAMIGILGMIGLIAATRRKAVT